MCKDTKCQTIKLSLEEFKPIKDAIDNINFYTVLEESDSLIGYDEWILKCTISKGMSKLSVSLWCPKEDSTKPETSKLLRNFKLILNLFNKE